MLCRRLVVLCVVLIACLIALKFVHVGLKYRVVHASEKIGRATHAAYVRIATPMDNSAPSTPEELRAGIAPVIIDKIRYLSRPYLVENVAPTFDSSGGDLILACASTHNGAILTPSDSYKNVWISLAGPTNSSAGVNLRSQMWYAKNPKTGPNHKFDVVLSSAQSLVISILVVKGASPSNPIDAVSAITDDHGMYTTTPSSQTVRTLTANDLLIGFGKGSIEEDWSAGDGFLFEPLASSDFLVAESGLAATPGDYKATFKFTLAATWQATLVAIRPAERLSPQAPIRLAWHPSNDNVRVAEYQIERCGGSSCTDFAQIGTSTETSFVDSNLSQSMAYRYRIRAVDEASNASRYSDVVEVDGDTGRDPGND